ncbi:hypothetical protein P692DRAFT_20670949, partial [Suillus brevipes Sb2]
TGADEFTVRIWNLDTSKLVAGPFKSMGMVGAVRFSTDSKKLTLKSDVGKCVEVWDIEPQKFDARFDASTLENIGVPFEEHTKAVTGLAPSFDGALLASAGEDDTIKV